ncbi:TPA: hypothetical protein KOR49_003797 [Clostridioides difficile]|uniref:DUF4116 domain-containing protein n=1 Tax=Clostridioides difficile TaxID=1496 RepID=UPI00016C631D|nr:DUF4116 domain-containing protein [Clostridioides difficile]EGT3944096.1 hypothetical protein [Clostridioides difficile]MBG0197988.1 hypothetical protein [Clostridioides difficile]MCA0574658.1 hypothetical protein [Clostridioides difficile]SJT20877.1 Uncharacterised protein [Clostridioides difficile]VHT46446.1 Uncharacterised protein [Clostridioides difficile]
MRKIDLDKIKIYPWDLKNVKTQTYEMCIEVLRRDGLSLKNIRWNELSLSEKQIFNLYIIAVRQNGLALEFIENQIDEICMEALKQNELAIKYVKDKKKYEKILRFEYVKDLIAIILCIIILVIIFISIFIYIYFLCGLVRTILLLFSCLFVFHCMRLSTSLK